VMPGWRLELTPHPVYLMTDTSADDGVKHRE
jgi:hypothetical protein